MQRTTHGRSKRRVHVHEQSVPGVEVTPSIRLQIVAVVVGFVPIASIVAVVRRVVVRLGERLESSRLHRLSVGIENLEETIHIDRHVRIVVRSRSFLAIVSWGIRVHNRTQKRVVLLGLLAFFLQVHLVLKVGIAILLVAIHMKGSHERGDIERVLVAVA